MKNSAKFTLGMAAAILLIAASVRADDIYPPPWQRGATNTTWQDWTFSTSNNPSTPDQGFFNPNGTPYSTITGTGNVWSAFYDNHQGVWTLSGANSSMDLGIPNTPYDATRIKNIWTQITWEPDADQDTPVVMVNGIAVTAFTTYPVGNGNWKQSVYETTLVPNPQYEDVAITGSYYLGEVVVDTICVPEPSSLALLAMGSISLLLYASRKRRLAA